MLSVPSRFVQFRPANDNSCTNGTYSRLLVCSPWQFHYSRTTALLPFAVGARCQLVCARATRAKPLPKYGVFRLPYPDLKRRLPPTLSRSNLSRRTMLAPSTPSPKLLLLMDMGALGDEDGDEEAPHEACELEGAMEENGVEEQPPLPATERARSYKAPPTISPEHSKWPRGDDIKKTRSFGTPEEPLCTAAAFRDAMVWALNPFRDCTIPCDEIFMLRTPRELFTSASRLSVIVSTPKAIIVSTPTLALRPKALTCVRRLLPPAPPQILSPSAP